MNPKLLKKNANSSAKPAGNNKNHSITMKGQIKKTKESNANVIDDIFRSAKKKKLIKKQEKIDVEQEKRINLARKLKKQWKMQEQLRRQNHGNIPVSTKTQGGIKIYTEQQLNIGQGGNTRLCPFDCQCCF